MKKLCTAIVDKNKTQALIGTLVLGLSVSVQANWTIQISAGSRAVLEQQAKALQSKWSDIRVIELDGKSKLVVGDFLTPSDAASLLLKIKVDNAQAFVRKIPNSANKEEIATTPEVVSPSPLKVVIPSNTHSTTALSHQPSIQSNTPSKVVQSEIVTETPSETTQPKNRSAMATNINDTKDIVKEDTILAVMPEIKPEVPVKASSEPEQKIEPERQPEKQPIDQSSDRVSDKPLEKTPDDILVNTSTTEEDALPATVAVAAEQSYENKFEQKHNIVLSKRHKNIEFMPNVELQAPVNLMLSPLYLLPVDADKKLPNQLTMQMLSEVVIASITPEKSKNLSNTAQTPAAKKSALMTQIAALVNRRQWQQAQSLAQQAETLPTVELTSTDTLLLGWVWLQNQNVKQAIRYFELSLKAMPRDEARYGLALSYLMIQDKKMVKKLYSQMSSSPQKDHLQSLM